MRNVVHVRVVAERHPMFGQEGTVPLDLFDEAGSGPPSCVFPAMFDDGPADVAFHEVEVVRVAAGHFTGQGSSGGERSPAG